MTPKLKKIIVILVIAVGILSWGYVAWGVYNIRSHRRIPWKYYLSTHRRVPVSPTDISNISSWMTFDYITRTFNLPGSYFEQTLGINDPKYPSITLSQYARKTNTNTGVLIENIQGAIKKYLASSTPQ